MKKIVPFNNVLSFDTDVNEITGISLEHDIKKDVDMISGVFYISGEYKKNAGSLESESFSFELPFDVALGSNYDLDTLEVDIDDFRYELNDNKLKVNIDLYIDGDVIETEDREVEPEKIDIVDNLDVDEDNEIDILGELNDEERYVTYHVYPVTEEDTIDKIMEKYNVTKEELLKYNDNLEIHKGDKLIIPSNDK